MSQPKPSKLETIKESSHQLRGHIADDLAADGTHFDESGKQLLKFHGLYQQDDRDQRKARRAAGEERAYQFMLRTRIPGGQLSGGKPELFVRGRRIAQLHLKQSRECAGLSCKSENQGEICKPRAIDRQARFPASRAGGEEKN